MYEKKGRYIVEFTDIPKARQHQIELPVEEYKGTYKEVELGFDKERAVQEAKRCLSCRRCLGCALCWAECKPEAIVFEMEDEYFDFEADEVIISPGVERPINRLDRRFGFGEHLNVITDLQLERMLSDTGPSNGLIIRPYDGEIPSSIAFVQSYESAAPQMHQAALFLGINEAILAQRKLPEAEIQIFAGNLDDFLKEQGEAITNSKVQIQDAKVTGIEALDNQSIKLNVSTNGSEQEKTFDLVVLMTQPQISKDVKSLSKSLGLNLGYYDFLAQGGKGLISTDKEAVQLVGQE